MRAPSAPIRTRARPSRSQRGALSKQRAGPAPSRLTHWNAFASIGSREGYCQRRTPRVDSERTDASDNGYSTSKSTSIIPGNRRAVNRGCRHFHSNTKIPLCRATRRGVQCRRSARRPIEIQLLTSALTLCVLFQAESRQIIVDVSARDGNSAVRHVRVLHFVATGYMRRVL